MDQLIPVVNKLQDVFGAIGSQVIDLPQIVVVGSQSSGKSSVLENIVGRDFLPRGSGIVTRRPLILQLYSLSSSGGGDTIPREDKSKGDEWGEFLHLPGQRFYDFAEIRAEIARETDRLTGRNKGISNKSINLKIYSPHVLNLTLVDLPGIMKIPIGDQPEDVEEQTRNMCLEFISNPNAIILAVTPANIDLVNSEGLKLAREIDPDGDRTVGVLTKVDMMDKGTDCVDILANKFIPLKKGYIAVVNRSQQDIQDGLPIRQGLGRETGFFSSHPKYRTCLSKCGTANLARSLSQILMHHIRDCLPDIKSRITKMMLSVSQSLITLGDVGEGQGALGGTLLRILSKYASSVSSSLEGRTAADGSVEMTELHGGARIAFVFNEIFGRLLWGMDPFEGLDDEDIRTAIANANGTRPSLFVPEISFDLLVRRQIARLEAPGIQCVEMVLEELQRLAQHCESQMPELQRFPVLRDRVLEVVSDMLRGCVKPAQNMVSSLVQVELAYVNTSHPDFIGGKQALAQVTKKAAHASAEASSTSGGVGMDSVVLSSTGAPSTPVPSSSNQTSGTMPPSMSPEPNRGAASMSNANTPAAGFFGLFRPPSNQPFPGASSDQQMMSGSATNSQQTPGNGVGRPLKPPTMRQPQHQPNPNLSSSRDSSGLVKLPQMPDRMKVTAGTNDWGRREVEIIKTLIRSYFDVVRKTFVDMVPKTVMHFLVNGFRDGLQNELVAQLYRESSLTELMRETEDVAARRKAALEMKELLQRALDIVNEVRDFKPSK